MHKSDDTQMLSCNGWRANSVDCESIDVSTKETTETCHFMQNCSRSSENESFKHENLVREGGRQRPSDPQPEALPSGSRLGTPPLMPPL